MPMFPLAVAASELTDELTLGRAVTRTLARSDAIK